MIYVLDNNENIQGVLSVDSPDAVPFYEDAFVENVDGSKELSFSVPVKPKKADKGTLAKKSYRYIRNTVNESTENVSNVFNEIKAFVGTTNVAVGASVSCTKYIAPSWVTQASPVFSTPSGATDFSYITDGNIDTWVIPAWDVVPQRIVIDLGSLQPLDSIQMYHYYLDGRSFHDNVLEVSEDGVSWTTIYNSNVQGEYVETSTGKLVTVPEDITYNINERFNLADYIVPENLLIYKTREDTLHLMRITDVTEVNEDGIIIKQVEAENSAVGDLFRNIVEPKGIPDGEGEFQQTWVLADLITYIMAGSGWIDIRVDADTTDDIDFVIDKYDNTYALLKRLALQLGLELEFTVKLDGLLIAEKRVEIKILGSPVQTTFYYGVDLTDVSREIDSKDIITTLLPVGKADEAKRKTTIEKATDPIEPLFQNDFFITDDNKRIYSKWALNRWGNGQHRVGFYENNDITDPNLLLAYAQQQLYNRIYPKVSYKMKLLTFNELAIKTESKPVMLGDDVLAIDKTFNPELRITARIVEKTTSYADHSKDEVVIGNVIEVVQDPAVVLSDLKRTVNYGNGAWDNSSGLDIEKDKINVGSITVGGKILATEIEKVPYYSSSSTTDDSYVFEINSAEELSVMLNALPKYMDKRLEIVLTDNIFGNIMIDGFYGGGEIVIKQGIYNINGYIYFLRCTCRCGISATTGEIIGTEYGQTFGTVTGEEVLGVYGCTEFTAYGLLIKGYNNPKYGIYISQSNCSIQYTQIYYVDYASYSLSSVVFLNEVIGLGNVGGLTTVNGGVICSKTTVPAGGIVIDATTVQQGTFTADAGSATPPTPTYITKTYYPTDVGTWRDPAWRTDTTDVIQGAWDGSDSTDLNYGLWLFGDNIYNDINGETVTSMRIYINRKSDAGYGTSVLKLKAHNIGTKTGSPVVGFFGTSVDVVINRGESKWVDITSLAVFFNANGGSQTFPAKGIGISTSSLLNTDYIRMLQDCIIEVTYTT